MFINGTDRILYIKWDEVFLPIGCLTSDSFDEDVEMLPTTTRGNNGWRTKVPTNQGYSINFDGILINSNFEGGDFTKVSLDRLRILKRDRTLIEWKLIDKNQIFGDSGFGYITSLSNSASIDEFITFNGTIEGYGEPIIDNTNVSSMVNAKTKEYNTYQDMLNEPYTADLLIARVLNDEDKNLENSIYLIHDGGIPIWVASVVDN